MSDRPSTEEQGRWDLLERLEPLLQNTSELSAEEREEFLRRACGDDPLLRAQAEKLLSVAEDPPSFFDHGAQAVAEQALEKLGEKVEPPFFHMPERLGPYQVVGEIGAGGMSRVYLGERDDGELSLRVAIKVMYTGRARRDEYERRFRAERQILASFDHGNIARVFDGGVMENDRPYLVMEYISGLPLTTYCERHRLGLEQRLELIVQVCSAVQYAHQRLVVHRDLKPSNILVRGDGRVKLLDFGIAKLLDAGAPGFEPDAEMPMTRTGFMLLTPEYAAPEQLRGQEVTTAVDIYALGALLYELLTGRRPTGSTTEDGSVQAPSSALAEARDQAEALDPAAGPATRAITWPAEQLQGDLDTVVLKALRGEAHRRYGSARELAEELRRFMAGEPVLARPIGPMEQIRRLARRHRRAIGALCLLVLMVGIVSYLRAGARSEAQAAQRFGQEVERIEAMLQRAYMAPRHDIRPELDEVRQLMAEIRRQLPSADGASRVSAEYALGRGHLSLGEEELARSHLQRAWDASQEDPRLAYALGLSLSRLYRQSLEELSQIRSPEVREMRRAEIDRQLRDPAVRAMEAAGVGTSHGEYAAASLDFFAGRTERALERLENRSHRESWFYEPDLLAGDIYSELQRTASESGQAQAARQAQEQAAAAYGRVIDVARSDPRGYEGLCNLWSTLLLQRYYTSKEDLPELRREALSACVQAVEVNPDRVQAHLRLGRTERLWAEHLLDQGQDPRALLEIAEQHLQQAIRLAPRDPRPWVVRGAGWRTRATFLGQRGEDPTEAYRTALASYDRAIEIDAEHYGAHLSRSLAELHLGDFERRRGGAAEAHFEHAIASGRRAVEIHPEVAGGYLNLGIAYGQLAGVRRDRSAPARDLFEQAVGSLRRALQIHPQYLIAHFNLGHILIQRGELELASGEDPAASIEAAQGHLGEVLQAWSSYAPILIMHAQAESLAARRAKARNEDPTERIAVAKEWAEKSVEIGVGEPSIFVESARIHLLEAHWSLSSGRSPESAIRRALELLDQGLAVDDRMAVGHQLMAEAHWLRACDSLARSKHALPELAAGLKAARRAIQENPADAESHLQMARLESLRAVVFSDTAEHRAAAFDALERALELRPDYPEARDLLRRLEPLATSELN